MLDKILDQFAEITLPEALLIIRKALPGNNNFMMLGIQVNMLEYDHYSGSITEETYKVGNVNKRNALSFFLKRLNEESLLKIDGLLKPDPLTPQVPVLKTEILFMAASPIDVDRLEINIEYDKIKNAIASTLFRDNWSLVPIMSVTINSMVNSLVAEKPCVVHFSGHSGVNGIVLTNDFNEHEVVKTDVLKSVFSQFKTDCIFLNGCYSAEVAKELSQFSNYVIGMNAPIGDKTATIFSSTFYGLLCNSRERDYLTSFNLAQSVLMVKKENESNIPEIWQNGQKIIS